MKSTDRGPRFPSWTRLFSLFSLLLAFAGVGPAIASAQDEEVPQVTAGLGQGVTLSNADGSASLQVRGRVQTRFSARLPEDEDTELTMQIRRARLVFLASLSDYDLQLYVQLGIAPSDVETDLPIVLRDAAITWSGLRDLSLRVGQMKVPFNRERVTSSSSLQFVDRSGANAELTLDRDIGVQLFSNDLFGWDGRIGYQLGVFGGEGRNRPGNDYGLLYVGHVQLQPLGPFDDASTESDITREARPRLSFGAGFAFNHRAQRERSTTGEFFALPYYDSLHLQADALFKYAGFSFHSELLARQTLDTEHSGVVEGQTMSETTRSGLGFVAQAGYMFPAMVELAARYTEVRPLPNVDTAIVLKREVSGAFNWFLSGHDLKWQTDYTYGTTAERGYHEVRTQLQLFF